MKKTIITLIIFLAFIGFLPCSAKVDGGISKSTFYDTEKTLMLEVSPDMALSTGKYWEKNIFYKNKYRPIFMLSNKELYKLLPEKKIHTYNRVSAPTIYNISLKDSSIKKVTLSQPIKNIEAKTTKAPPAKIATIPVAQTNTFWQAQDALSTFMFEQAKNKGVDTDAKIVTALTLKETKKPANYSLAIDLLDDVTRLEPYNAEAYNLKAELYLAKNDPKKAMQNYIEVLNLNPYSKESCLGIARILEPTNKLLAQKYYDRANQQF